MQAYNDIDQRLHLLSQVITKANRTYVPPQNDDSHTNLYYDALGSRIVGRWIKTPKGQLMLSLNLSNFQFEWMNSSLQKVKQFDISGKTILEVEQEISDHLDIIGLDPKGFTDKLHYDIPSYPFAAEIIQEMNESDLTEWKHYRNMANQACALLLGHIQIEGELRIWPHHFDTGIYVVTGDGMGVGFGLAMQDSLLDDPYFYMSGYPAKGSLKFENLPNLTEGKWINSDNWKGAVLPLIDLGQIPKINQIKAVKHFLFKTAQWFINQKLKG